MARIKTAIEMSLDGIKVVKGYQDNGKYIVLSAVEGKEINVNEYGLMDTQECIDSLTALLGEVRKNAGDDLGDLIFLLPPETLEIRQESAEKTPTIQQRISQLDYANCINLVNKKLITEGYSIIYDDPYLFSHDNKSEISDFPSGVRSSFLSVFADVHLIKNEVNNYYNNIFKNLGLTSNLKLIAPFAGIQYFVGQHAEGSFFSLQVEKTYSYFSLYKSGRMLYSEMIDFGTNTVIDKASAALGLSKERTGQLLNIFGLRSDAGFNYATEEGYTLSAISNAFVSSYTPLFDRVISVIRKYDPDRKTYIILTGSGSEVDFLDKALSFATDRMGVSKLNMRQIGARSTVYVNCLGAIRIAAYDYQKQPSETYDPWNYSGNMYDYVRNK